MPSSKAPKAGGGALLKTWRQEGPSGARAKFWLRLRRAASILVALCLVGWLAYLVFSPLFLPKTYFAYWCLDEVQPLVAPPIEFAYEDFAGFAKLQSSLTPIQQGRPLLYGRMAVPELVDKQILGLKEAGIADDDTLILFVSAHGVTREGKAYLMCSNYTDAVGSQSRGQGLIEVSDFLKRIEGLRGATKLLLLDAARCEYAPRLGVTINVFAETLRAEIEKLNLSDVYVLCANSAGESSHVSHALRRSIFGYMTATGLQGAADIDDDGEVNLPELHEFVRVNVSEWVKQATDGLESQTPVLLGADVRRAAEKGSHLLYTGGLPEVARESESSDSIASYVTDFMTDEVGEFGFEPIIDRLAAGAERAKDLVSGDEDKPDDAAGGEGAESGPSDEEPGLNQEQGELGLLTQAWELTDAVGKGPNSPLEFAPHLWQLHKDRLLWLEHRQQAGLRLDERSLVEELRGVIQSLKDFQNPGKKPPQQPRNVVDRIRLRRPSTPLDVGEAPSLALAELVVTVDPKASLPPKLGEFIREYDSWLAGSEGLDELNAILEKSADDSWQQLYEFQHLDTLRTDPEIPLETVKFASEVRRLGEQVATDLLWGQGWGANLVEQADRLRWEAERLLADKAASDWKTRSTQNLQRARRFYLDARDQISLVRQAKQLQRELLSNARDYLRWCRFGSGDSSSRAPSAQSLESLFASLTELRTEVNSPDRLRAPDTLLLDRVRKDLERRIVESVSSLTDESPKEGDARRIDSLLNTALLSSAARSECISARLKAEGELMRSFTFKKSASSSPQVLSTERLGRAAEQILAERKLVECFAPGDREIQPAAEASAISIDELGNSGDVIRERLSEVPGEVLSYASANSDLSDWQRRREQLDQLGRAVEGLYLIDAMDLSASFEDTNDRDLMQTIRNAQWFDLLVALRERYWRSIADAPQEDLIQLDRLGRKFAELAARIPRQTKLTGRPLSRVELQVSQSEVELIANDESDLDLTVRAAGDMPVWIMAQYDQNLIDVSSSGWTVLKEHAILAAPANEPTADTRYPYRPDARRGTPPPLLLSAGQSRNLQLKVRRMGAAKGDATLVLKAVGQPDYIRQQVPIRLPGQQDLQFSIAGAETIGRSGSTLGLFPNCVQNLTIQVANTGSEPKSYTATIYAPQQAPAMAIPTGSIESSASEQILRRLGPRKTVALGAVLKIATGGEPAPILFDFDSPGNKALLGADAKAGPIRIPLSQGLLLDLIDEDTKDHIIRWLPIEVWRPRAYVKARATYDPGDQELTVIVEALRADRFPIEPVPVVLNVDEKSLSGRERRFSATLDSPNERAELRAFLNGTWPRDYNDMAADYLPVYVHVNGYPRGFEFRIRPATETLFLDPVEDPIAVRVVSPLDSSRFKATSSIPARFEIDAPEGYFRSAENYIEFGIDVDDDRDLDENDEVLPEIKSDRRVQYFALKPTAEGTVAIDARVGDYEVDLPTEGINGKVNVLGQFKGEDEQSDYVEIVLDGDNPVVDSPKFIPDGETLIVQVHAEDPSSGVKLVEGAFDSEKLNWQKGQDQGGGTWRVILKTDGLAPREHQVLIKSTDNVGNAREEIVGTWSKSTDAAQPQPQRDDAAGKAAVAPVKNRVSGRLTYGRKPVSKIEVKLVGAGAPGQPVRSQGDTFDFGMVPPGEYALTARGLAGGNYHDAELQITVSDQPETPWREEVPIR